MLFRSETVVSIRRPIGRGWRYVIRASVHLAARKDLPVPEFESEFVSESESKPGTGARAYIIAIEVDRSALQCIRLPVAFDDVCFEFDG